MLHEPHKRPEPILVISGLSYLLPLYVAATNNRLYDASTYGFLTLTTVGFHSTRNETFFKLDLIAMLNWLVRNGQLSLRCSNRSSRNVLIASLAYCFTSYALGKRHKIMSFDRDWNTQMFFHSLMHFSTAYSSYLIMKDITSNRKKSRGNASLNAV
jgi:hypothetical protein